MNNHYIAPEGKVYHRIGDDSGNYASQLWLGCKDSINNYELIDKPTPIEPVDEELEKVKEAKISQTKALLKQFLESVKLPSKAHNNTLGYYSVTEEKQSLLMGNFFAYQLEKQINPEAKLTWNESGKSCEEWTEEEVTQLMLEIKNFVKPVVAYQQNLEEQINACETISEVEGIVIDYEQFKTW